MNKCKFLSFLGIARKSGNLVFGMDAVKTAVLKGKVQCVLVASDISSSSFKKIKYICEENNVKILRINFKMEELYFSVRKKSGIIAVKDENFSKKLMLLNEQSYMEELDGKKI